ncbi:MAG TPA: SCO family protein [Thermoanaerobaculia bacterium]
MKRALFLCGLLLAGAACRHREAPIPARIPARPILTPPPPVSAAAKRYPLKGVITAVAPAKSEITVQHGEIPGAMPAMTMSFPVRDDPKVVALLRPGDRVEATLVVDGDVFFLERILTKGFVRTPTPGGAGAVRPEPNRGIAVGEAVPDFALTDQTGKPVRLSQFRGEPVAVTFVYTRCPVATACPMTMAKFSRLSAALKKARFGVLLAITVDPQDDTTAVLKDYASKVGADPAQWKFLTGDPAAVARVAETFGVLYYPERGQIIHSQTVAVVDPKGRLATIYFGERWEPEMVLQELEKARKG